LCIRIRDEESCISNPPKYNGGMALSSSQEASDSGAGEKAPLWIK
jgi:hypothetical protein